MSKSHLRTSIPHAPIRSQRTRTYIIGGAP